MIQLIVLSVVLYGVWVFYYFRSEKRLKLKTEVKSRMGSKKRFDPSQMVVLVKAQPRQSRTTPASLNIAESTDNKAIIFVHESKKEQLPDEGNEDKTTRAAQVPNERLDEVFAHQLPDIPDVSLSYEEQEPEVIDAEDEFEEFEDETFERRPLAKGVDFLELGSAVRVADSPSANLKERNDAAEVFSRIEGNTIYEALTAGNPLRKATIEGLIDRYLNGCTDTSSEYSEGIAYFDIADYV